MTDGGRVIWITGFSGAGKTTLARALVPHLGPRVILLDGDELREALDTAHSGFERDQRQRLAFTYARLTRLLARQGFTVVVATISLFHSLHEWNRANLPDYLEVYLDVPEEERVRRDPKGLYAARREGKSHAPMASTCTEEVPLAPHLSLPYRAGVGVEDSVQKVLDRLRQGPRPLGTV